MSVSDRLSRLLFIVPYAASRDGVPLQELADLLQVKPGQIEADLDLLSMVGQPPLTPDHLIDLYVEDDIVYVDLDQSLIRPLHLTHEEARSLVLGAKLAGRLGGLGDQLEELLERIVAKLNPADREVLRSLSQRIGISATGSSSFEPAERLREAIDTHREVVMDYYSASSDRQKSYRVRPLAVLTHSGVEYVVAQDMDAKEHEKLFRLDRLAAVDVTESTFEPPPDFNLEKYRRQNLYSGTDDTTAKVRFSAQVARQVIERFPESVVDAPADGSVTVRLNTSSAAWLARWVLPFGTEAEVLGPSPQRDWFGQFCSEAAAAYS